jgi:hypothetical protein
MKVLLYTVFKDPKNYTIEIRTSITWIEHAPKAYSLKAEQCSSYSIPGLNPSCPHNANGKNDLAIVRKRC